MRELKLKFLPVLVVAATVAGAADITPSMKGTINRVDVGRQEIDQRGGKLVQEANELFADGKYMAAKDKYLQAIKEYDKYSTGVFAERSDFCRKRISDCYFREAELAMRRADELSHVSDYDEAIKTCRHALEYCDSAQKEELNRRIAVYEKRRDDVAERDSVSQERLLPNQKDQEYQVQVLMEQGRKLAHNKEYVRAARKFQEVMLINPFNTDALQCLAAVNEKIKLIGVTKYRTEHRRLMGETEWKNAIPYQSEDEQGAKNLITTGDVKPKPEVRGEALRKRLAAIKLDRVALQEVTVADAVDYLRAEAAKKDPEKRGVNIVFLRTVKGKKANAAANRNQEGEENAGGAGDAGDGGAGAGAGAADGGAGDEGQGQNNAAAAAEKPDEQISLEVKGKSLLEVIEALCSSTKDPKMRYQIDDNAVLISPENFDLGGMLTKSLQLVLSEDTTDDELKAGMIAEGIKFRPGAGVAYFPSLGRVVIKNDSENLALMEEYLENKSASGSGALIQVQIKLIEIAQDDLDELAFNWQYSVNTNQSYYTNGRDYGTSGSDLTRATIIQPSSNELLRYYIPDNHMTTQLEDANYSFMWANSDGTKISAHMSALDWADSKDVLASPRITTVPGHTAMIKMVTKRYFPDDWDSVDFDTLASWGENYNGYSVTAVSPQPDLSKEEELGVTFTIKPELVGTDMIKIPLKFPIKTFANEWVTYDYRTGDDDDDDDYISMPVFNKRSFNTTVMLHDGETIVFGGVNKDDTTTVSDKIPILGDLPFIGRFFQSKYSKSSKGNLLVFITARLVKPDGSAFFPDRQLARGVPEFGNID